MGTTYQRLDWGRSGILATIDAMIRLTKAADRLGPTRIKKCHASFVAECALFAMLDNAVNTLLAVLYGRVSERVECVVNAIDEDANAPEKLSGVKPSRVEGPNVQAQCVGVLDVQSVPGNSEDNVAAAVMLKRIFSGATAAEYTFVRGPLPPLHSPVCAPPVKQRMNDRCLDTRRNKLGESNEKTPVMISGPRELRRCKYSLETRFNNKFAYNMPIRIKDQHRVTSTSAQET